MAYITQNKNKQYKCDKFCVLACMYSRAQHRHQACPELTTVETVLVWLTVCIQKSSLFLITVPEFNSVLFKLNDFEKIQTVTKIRASL